MWINGVSDKFPQTDNSGPVRVKIPTSDKALRQQHKTDKMATNNMKTATVMRKSTNTIVKN